MPEFKTDSRGYTLVRSGLGDPWEYLHRIVAAEKIGRGLTRGDYVHHIDEDKTNNHPDNLIVCSAKEHRALHVQYEKIRKETTERLLDMYPEHPLNKLLARHDPDEDIDFWFLPDDVGEQSSDRAGDVETSGGTDPSTDLGTGQGDPTPHADPRPEEVPSTELPGMWDHSDFLGGRDEPSALKCPNCDAKGAIKYNPAILGDEFRCRCGYREER